MRRLLVLVALLAACSHEIDTPGTSTPGVCVQSPPPQKVAGACEVTLEQPPVASNVNHVKEGTQVTYCSNPPSSGDHYLVWAGFQEIQNPVELPYLVHSMEHGAIVLFYKCDPACPEIVQQLRDARARAAADPACEGQGTDKRIIIVPNPALDVRVAAAAWGATYKADCVDGPSLDQFIKDHYAKAPEDFCIAGRAF